MKMLTLQAPASQNGQTHSNNLSAVADELFECVWPFCGVDTERVKIKSISISSDNQMVILKKNVLFQEKKCDVSPYLRAH